MSGSSGKRIERKSRRIAPSKSARLPSRSKRAIFSVFTAMLAPRCATVPAHRNEVEGKYAEDSAVGSCPAHGVVPWLGGWVPGSQNACRAEARRRHAFAVRCQPHSADGSMIMVHPKRVLLCGLASTALLTGGCASPAQRFNPPGAVSESGRYAAWSRPLSRTHVSAIVERIRQRSKIVAGAGRGRLLYVADPFANAVLIYTYPQLSGAGELTGFTSVTGVCTDRRGYVWVLDTNDVLAW